MVDGCLVLSGDAHVSAGADDEAAQLRVYQLPVAPKVGGEGPQSQVLARLPAHGELAQLWLLPCRAQPCVRGQLSANNLHSLVLYADT